MQQIDTYYFLGIGGIGMSAIARYFKAKGFEVAGYDRTSTVLTRELEAEGIKINYVDEVEAIPFEFAYHTDWADPLIPGNIHRIDC